MFETAENNLVLRHAEKIQAIIDNGGKTGTELDTPEKLEKFDKTMDLTFEEHFSFQELQAHAHVMQKLTTGEAQVVYNALGEHMHEGNGGWTPGTSLALKVTITNLMGELLNMKIKSARARR